jgi:predicted RNase H-like HicB family nuclease
LADRPALFFLHAARAHAGSATQLLDLVLTPEIFMDRTLEYEQEADGRWLAEVPQLPGVMAYGRTPADAMAKAQALALRALAERIERDGALPVSLNMVVPIPA